MTTSLESACAFCIGTAIKIIASTINAENTLKEDLNMVRSSSLGLIENMAVKVGLIRKPNCL